MLGRCLPTLPVTRCTGATGFRPRSSAMPSGCTTDSRLSHRDVEDLLAERGVRVSYEAIRLWCPPFRPAFAVGLRRRRARAGDTWHLDEVQLKINGTRDWLWRAVDQHGLVLDILVQARRDQQAGRALPAAGAGGRGEAPRVVITDKLASFRPPSGGCSLASSSGATSGSTTARRTPPARAQARAHAAGFKSPEHVQRFREPFSAVQNHFRPRHHLSLRTSTTGSAPSASTSGGSRRLEPVAVA